MEKTLQQLGEKLQQEKLSPFVYMFSILPVEVRYGAVPYFTDKKVGVSWTAVEKFISQTVNKLVNGFKIKSGQCRIKTAHLMGNLAISFTI
jgi:hypothetical protein